MEPTIESLLIEALKFGGIDHTKPDAYEIWLRHIEDEEEFLSSTGIDLDPESVLRWAFSAASDTHYEGWDGIRTARKFILNIWKKRNAQIDATVQCSDDAWLDFPFIAKAHAKTLPEGTEETSFTLSTKSGSSRSTTRHIKNGKWVRGRAQK